MHRPHSYAGSLVFCSAITNYQATETLTNLCIPAIMCACVLVLYCL